MEGCNEIIGDELQVSAPIEVIRPFMEALESILLL